MRNCIGGSNEPFMVYPLDQGFHHTDSSFWIQLKLYDSTQDSLAHSNSLSVTYGWSPYDNSAMLTYGTSPVYTESLPGPLSHVHYIKVDNIPASTIVAVAIMRFFTYYDITVEPSPALYYRTKTGDPGYWATYGTLDVRTRAMLRALREISQSDTGKVGYRGNPSVDGTLYGADPGEIRCSEFYSDSRARIMERKSALGLAGDLFGTSSLQYR